MTLALMHRLPHPASRASFIPFSFIFHYTEKQSICTIRKGSACRVRLPAPEQLRLHAEFAVLL